MANDDPSQRPGSALAGPDEALAAGQESLTEPQAKALLRAHGIGTPRGCFVPVRAADEALTVLPFAGRHVLKVVSRQILHKSDVGGVRVGLDSVAQVRTAMRETAHLPGLEGWLLEEMVDPGLELVVGGSRHPRFGPMIVVGLGGVLVEYLEDIALRICPVDAADARDMLASLRAAPLLDGVRGAQSVDRNALVDLICRVGGPEGVLMRHRDTVAELDLNPVIASANGAVAADARVILSRAAQEESRAACDDVGRLLHPNAVAVAGASAGGSAYGNQYIRHLRNFGYPGPIYPVHPSAAEIDGLPAYRSLADLPQRVDYAFLSVSADRCPGLIAAAADKVCIAQVMAGGFGEGDAAPSSVSTEDGGAGSLREDGLLQAARHGGMRLLGPNCMGSHSPAGRLTYVSSPDPTPGPVAVIAQSGGLSMDVIRRGAQRGVRFRAVVSVGNCADLGPAELLPYFFDDPQTQAIGLYLEDARRGRALFELARAARGRKPIALLVGGRTAQGARAAQSHTGAMAGDARAWEALARQCGMAVTDTLDEFLNLLLAMQVLSPHRGRATREVVLFGNGGGASVLAADAFARAGLEVTPLPATTRARLRALDLPQGASVTNPVDIPANVLQRQGGALAAGIIDQIFTDARPDAFVIHVNVPVILGYTHVDILGQLLAATLAACDRALHRDSHRAHVVLVLRSDGEPEVEARKAALRAQALAAGIAVFDELDMAARALGGLARYEAALAAIVPPAGAPGPSARR